MPKAALLLLLLLLAGGYFLITSFTGGSVEIHAPGIDANAKLVRGGGGYTLVLEGVVKLPREAEYRIHGITARLFVDGAPSGSKSFGPATVSGPTTYPFSFSPTFSTSAGEVVARVEANVSEGKESYVLSLDVPVALPDKSLLVKSPELSLWLSALRFLGSSKSLTFSITVHNPNDAELRFESLSLLFGGSEYSLGVDRIPAGSSVTATQTVSVPPDVRSISLAVKGEYSVGGVKGTFERAFDVNVPPMSGQPLRFHLSAKVISISREGYEFNFFGSVENPNAFNVTLDSLSLKIVKGHGEGNVVQEVALLRDVDLLPESSKSFSKTVNVSSALTDAVAEAVAEYWGESRTVVSFPLPVIRPSEFLDAPSVKLSALRDGNVCRVTPLLSGPEYNVDVRLSLELRAGGNTIASKDYGEFVLSGSKTLEPVDADVNGPVEATLSGRYGIREMGVWFPVRYSVELNCTT